MPTQVPIASPITCAHARQLNHQASSLLSSCPSCLDHGDACTLVLLRNKGKTDRELDSRRLDSDCNTASNCDGRHGRIRTRIGAIKYLMGSLRSLFSYG
jgi:hypothetical protein